MSALPDTLVHRVRPAAGEPEGALVLLHGRGADENDLFPFLDLLDPERRLVGVTPGAPLSLPPGGRHWYVVPRVGFPEPRTFHDSLQRLDALLGAIPDAFGVPEGRTVIGGFSQGTVMAYAVGLGRGRPSPAGIVALSGFLPTVQGWQPDLGRPGLPVFIAHGRQDPVISVQFAQQARDQLTAAGLDVTYRESDAGHQVDPRTVAELPGWLDAAMTPPAPRPSGAP
ncbi:MAG: phospholipase/carboxylesterase [Solirubrobacteraceae bacterium]|nr:phospholipase/carboxylesterase [Solirubrobacteraceae bacterium]